MFNLPPVLEASIVFFLIALILAVIEAEAQDVTYCKNYETGEIIVVDAGMPCPYPTVQL